MGSRIECFFIEATDRARCALRRYVPSSTDRSKCTGAYGYHNATFDIGERQLDAAKRAEYFQLADRSEPLHDDSRWPAKCDSCDFAFGDDDAWQLFWEVLYVRKDTGAEMTLRSAPPDAMYDADWLPEKGPDGRSLVVCLPPGGGHDCWHVDGPSNSGGRWTRSGEIPLVTVSPSILTPRYHGFLRNGFLEEC